MSWTDVLPVFFYNLFCILTENKIASQFVQPNIMLGAQGKPLVIKCAALPLIFRFCFAANLAALNADYPGGGIWL